MANGNGNTRNWDDVGLAWVEDEVAERAGPNATDRRVLGIAQLPVFADLDKAKAAGIDVLGWLNSSNSPRVRAQALERDALQEKPVPSVETRRERIFNALKGVRNNGTRTVTVYVLPNGEKYTGTDLNEYRQLYAAALVDMGTPSNVALGVAQNVKF